MSARVYKVTNTHTNESTLVEAHTQSQAVKFVTGDLFKVKNATAQEVAHAMKNGGKYVSALTLKEKANEPTDEHGNTTKQLGGE